MLVQGRDLEIYQFTNVLIYQFIDLPMYRFTNVLIYRFTDIPIYRFTNLSIYQFTDLPIYQGEGRTKAPPQQVTPSPSAARQGGTQLRLPLLKFILM